ncbi:MAG: CPBP family intramembrane glutamic endopeptidase [Peptoniphilaceae bacterium]
MQSVNLIISSVIQIMLFSLIPFIWWFLKKKKEISFFQWIGIKKPVIVDKRKYVISFLITIILFSSLSFIIPLFIKSSDTATSQFAGQGISALIPALIYSFLQTGLSEEILFRGFLTKRLINNFRFKVGNFIQAMLFGLMHGILFLSIIGTVEIILVVFLTGGIGLLMGWINEKQSGGSIISSWLLHGIANISASIIAIFSLI